MVGHKCLKADGGIEHMEIKRWKWKYGNLMFECWKSDNGIENIWNTGDLMMTLAYSKSVVGAWYEDDGSQNLSSGSLFKHFSPVYSLVQCYTWNTKLQPLIDHQLKKYYQYTSN